MTLQPASDGLNEREALARKFRTVRAESVALAAPLTVEDQTIQTIAEVSPTKWHLAHTSWFFETFLLAQFNKSYAAFDARFNYLFNSYYEAVGARHPREQRGLLSRPGVSTVMDYRRHVDAAMAELIASAPAHDWPGASRLIELGCHHEQQHQELLLMDIKHVFSVNPLEPAYAARPVQTPAAKSGADFIPYPGGLYEIGHSGNAFAFDNEGPRHKVWLEPFALMNRAVTVGEYLKFIEDGGYDRPEFWLSDGWASLRAQGWMAPQYWTRNGADWSIFTLARSRALEMDEPVCHVSYFEADAYARWAGARLPSEAEWEVAATRLAGCDPEDGNFAHTRLFHPSAAGERDGLQQMFGDVWEWTQSSHSAYPRYRPEAGAVGEYNGKFMSGQMVLRGGSAVTPRGHMRASYRNFFPPFYRLVFAGIRLAKDV